MKPTQTVVLLLILVVMVFAVTFASMYVRQAPEQEKKANKSEPPKARLTFAASTFPPRDGRTAEEGPSSGVVSEFGRKAHHDFWFENANDEEVRVGLYSKNCTCSDVQMFIAPPGWRRELAAGAGRRLGLMAHVLLPALVSAGAEDSFRTMEKDGAAVPVPPRAAGFIRLMWEGRAGSQGPKAQLLKAELWTKHPGGVPDILQAGVVMTEPLRVDTIVIHVGVLGPGDAAEGMLRCWSSTRTAFGLEVRSAGEPFVVCHKEALTADDQQELLKSGLPVVCGYRVRVAVRERTADGKRFDEGPFNVPFTLVPKGVPAEPFQGAVRGVVRGDVTVAGGSEIFLEPFAARSGTRFQATLQSERADLQLALERHPPFMKVSLEKLAGASGRWRLDLTIDPNRVSGSFPRSDSELYRDTAIYLKIAGEDGRRVRIPVSGKALQ